MSNVRRREHIPSPSDDNVDMRSAEAPLYVRLLSGLVKLFPDFDFRFIKPIRSRAVALLQLSPGAQVLDVGCGSGGGFPYLVACNSEMGVEERARQGAMLGAKHSDAHRHREHSQRRSVPRIARAATSDFTVIGH